MLPLEGKKSYERAMRIAMKAEGTRSRPQLERAIVGKYDGTYQATRIRRRCGRKGLERTVIVYFRRLAYPETHDKHYGTSYVSRFGTGYRVWLKAD
jgi:hypothetical protein